LVFSPHDGTGRLAAAGRLVGVAAFLANFVSLLVFVLWLLVLGRVVVSWVDPLGRNALSAFLIQTTEPLLAPIRRLLPPTGMIDFSPLILMLILGVILRVVRF
jgi:YggT family protein